MCKNAFCGDGLIQDNVEQCDDGANNANNKACKANCTKNICGDGFVGPGEACDDGNQSNDDACTNVCKSAACGDGFKQPGEACDAGVNNNNNGGVCTLSCTLPKCGDGFVQPGETCDDKNLSNNDACLNTCQLAKCGDAVIYQGVEQCDDGNAVNNDLCSNLCVSATCNDGVKNAAETDVDCGGGVCSKCVVAKVCNVALDCQSGLCQNGKCGDPTSCKALKTANPGLQSGVYDLDPDGVGPNPPFAAFCDMDFDGGGWTLVLKADGNKTTFLYDNAIWLNNATYQPQFPSLDRNEAKLESWNQIAFTEVLLGLESPILNAGALVLKYQKLPVVKASMFALMSPNAYVATNIGRAAWKALITGSSLQPNCNREGFNSIPAGGGWERMRIGIVSNQENDCGSPDSYIGIGGQQNGGCSNVPQRAVGNMADCGPDNGLVSIGAFGVVLVR
jgi:cysteine-rich repeat protein